MIEDRDLELPAAPPAPSVIPSADGPLVRAAPAANAPVVCAARRVLVHASELRGILAADADGEPLVAGVTLEGAPPAANVLVTPRSLERELTGPGGTVREILLVPERLPGFVVQWTGHAPPSGWTLTVQLLAGDDDRVRHEGTTLRVADARGAGLLLHLAGTAASGGWTVERTPAGPVARIALDPDADRPVTLLVDRVDADGRLPSLPALAAVVAHRRRDDLEPVEAPGIVVRTGVPDVDDGVAWARAALRRLLEEGPTRSGVRRLDAQAGTADLAMAALAAGEWDVARAAIAAPPEDAADVEALASWMAWTAEPGPFVAHLDALVALAPTLTHPLRALVADAAEGAGEEQVARTLRAMVDRAAEGTTARRLPTIGTASGPGAGAPTAQGPTLPSDANGTLAAYRRRDADAGFALLRPALTRLLREGPEPDARVPAAILDALVRGMLGVIPDAAYGRVRVAPRLPAHWLGFRLDGLRIGDATVGIESARPATRPAAGPDADAATVTLSWALRQTAGGAPVTWIFEPTLPLTAVHAVRIDGQPAELDVTPTGEGIRIRVQLPAERERTVEIEGTAAAR